MEGVIPERDIWQYQRPYGQCQDVREAPVDAEAFGQQMRSGFPAVGNTIRVFAIVFEAVGSLYELPNTLMSAAVI